MQHRHVSALARTWSQFSSIPTATGEFEKYRSTVRNFSEQMQKMTQEQADLEAQQTDVLRQSISVYNGLS